VFALCHEPAFAAQHPDCLAVHKEDRDMFVKTFLDNGGIFFFAGHDHFYNHAEIKTGDGIFYQIICGTDGAPLKKWNQKYQEKDINIKNISYLKKRGYVQVTVNGEKIKLEYIVYSENDGSWKAEDVIEL
jgi:hypothetical protein